LLALKDIFEIAKARSRIGRKFTPSTVNRPIKAIPSLNIITWVAVQRSGDGRVLVGGSRDDIK